MTRKAFINILAAGLFLLPLLAPLKDGLLLEPHLFKYLLSSPFVILLLSLYFINNGFEGHCHIIKTPINYLGIIFLTWALISISWAHNIHNAMVLWMQYLMAFFIFILVLSTLQDKQDVTKLLLSIFVSGVVVAFVGILQELFDFAVIRQAEKPASFFGNKNMAVHFIVLSLPLALGLVIDSRKTVDQVLYLIGLSIMITYLYFTQTRAGILAFSMQILVLIVFQVIRFISKDPKIKYSLSVVFGILIVLSAFFIYNNRDKFAESIPEERGASIITRVNAWQNTLAMIYDRPMSGTGLANWDIYYPLYHSRIAKGYTFREGQQLKNAHNDYLTILSELGVIGFLALLAIAFWVIKKMWPILKNPNHAMHYLTLSLILALTGFSINAGFSFPLSMYLPPVIIMVYLAIIVFASNQTTREDKKIRTDSFYRLPRKLTMLIGIIGFVFSIYYFYNNLRHIKAEDLYFQAEVLERKGNWPQLYKVALQSYRLNPDRTRISAYIGQAKMHLGQTQEAIKYFNQALSLAPYNINTMSFFAQAYIAHGDYESAEKTYLSSLKIYPDWAKAHKNIGVLYLNNLKQPREAIKHLKIALELNPDIHQAEIIRKLINDNSQ